MPSNYDNTASALRFGCVGIRGYGGVACDLLAQHHARPEDGVRFVAACDPEPNVCKEQVDRYQNLGVEVFTSSEELLAMDLDAVWLPTPIHMHRELTVASLQSGKAVICEKPAAGCVDEVDRMITARDKAKLPVIIGFQHLFDPKVIRAKQRLVGGELGKIKRAVVYGCWPRTKQYYARNNWAGRMRLGQSIINDSPASNAMSHFIMLALYMLGSTEGKAAEVSDVKPYLYRAADIETYDTISMRIITKAGHEIDVHLSHASRSEVAPTVSVQTEHGGLTMTEGRSIATESEGRREETAWSDEGRSHIATTMSRLLRGEIDSYEPASLENAWQHVKVCELASQKATVIDVNPSIVRREFSQHNGEGTVINDIEVMISECVRNGQLLTTLAR